MLSRVKSSIELESVGGIVPAWAALAALVMANSPVGEAYGRLIAMQGEVRIADLWLVLAKPLVVGLATALAVPLRSPDGGSPLARAEHALHP